MHLITEPQVNESSIQALIDILESENFAEACCIGHIDESTIYLRCPESMHGVIVNTEQLNHEVASWAVRCLKDSLTVITNTSSLDPQA